MNEDARPPADRMESFYREIEEATDHSAELHDSEVAVTAVGKGDVLTVDLRPALAAGLRYGLVCFDGDAGDTMATLHFKPHEHTADG